MAELTLSLRTTGSDYVRRSRGIPLYGNSSTGTASLSKYGLKSQVCDDLTIVCSSPQWLREFGDRGLVARIIALHLKCRKVSSL
jgi:hypothetical protein